MGVNGHDGAKADREGSGHTGACAATKGCGILHTRMLTDEQQSVRATDFSVS